MFKIKDKNIYTDKNVFLKNINCPMNVSIKNLEVKSPKHLLCKSCKKIIVDTEYIKEEELMNILKKDKNTCIKISKLNPMFKFV